MKQPQVLIIRQAMWLAISVALAVIALLVGSVKTASAEEPQPAAQPNAQRQTTPSVPNESKPTLSAEAALQKVDRWLAKNRPKYYATMQLGVTDAQLDLIEKRLGLKLPADFRALYRWRNGQSPDSTDNFFENWMFLSLRDAVETKEMLDGMIGHDFEDPKYWRRGWVPFLANGAGSYLCLDLKAEDGGKPGQLVAFWKRDQDRPVEAPSMLAWLNKIVSEMESGKYRAD